MATVDATTPAPSSSAILGQAATQQPVSVFREAHFNAAHRLYRPDWSPEKNQAVFGLCNNPNWHGHNYKLIVRVTGTMDPDTGYVIDLKVLKDIIDEQVADRFDHKNLNMDLPEFAELNPTAENIAVVAWQRLREGLDAAGHADKKLHLRLYETPRNFVEFPAAGGYPED
jgi:6-pyruvoyltetrahydropterin/6-carboxytetrahydropterin synthase